MVGKTAILIMCVAVLLSPSSACILKYVRISSYDLVLVRSNDLSPLLLLGHLVFCALQHRPPRTPSLVRAAATDWHLPVTSRHCNRRKCGIRT